MTWLAGPVRLLLLTAAAAAVLGPWSGCSSRRPCPALIRLICCCAATTTWPPAQPRPERAVDRARAVPVTRQRGWLPVPGRLVRWRLPDAARAPGGGSLAPSGHRHGCGRCAGARSAAPRPGRQRVFSPGWASGQSPRSQPGETGRQEPQLNHAIWMSSGEPHITSRSARRPPHSQQPNRCARFDIEYAPMQRYPLTVTSGNEHCGLMVVALSLLRP